MHKLRRKTLAEVAKVFSLDEPKHDAIFRGVSTDSRTVHEGELFFALRGDNFDGHAYLAEVAEKDAVAAVVDHQVEADIPQFVVADTRIALGRLAQARRVAFDGPVIAITGSNGKTTVKEMTAAILGQRGPVLATRGNFNNDIGLPLTVFRLEENDQFMVLEMGANHAGEIAYLAEIGRPDVAVITNAGAAHLEGFGSVENVAKAKGELFSHLDKDKTAVINLDDHYAPLWRKMSEPAKQLTFAIDNEQADVRALDLEAGRDGTRFRLLTPAGEAMVLLQLFGRHNVLNALAAAACALAVGSPLEDVVTGLEGFTAVDGRLKPRVGLHGALLIDDAYNANPDSMRAAVDVLASLPAKRVLVMGDMLEMGAGEKEGHADIGRYARAAGIEHLFAYGPLSASAVEAFGQGGQHFTEHEALIEALEPLLSTEVSVLVKGSRGMRMERVVSGLAVKQSAGGDLARGES